ncbi:MAG: hypothetical protein WC929_02430 [Bacilli bacterium]|jgi:uncharacterized protein YegL
MKENLMELVFIIDRSGSMAGLERDTIDGYNSFIQEQKKVEGEVTLSTVLFNDSFDVVHNRVDIRSVKPLTKNEYYAQGSTALLDAIGRSIVYIGERLEETKEEKRPSKVMFVITTDGMENSSCEYTYKRIKEMIKHQTEIYSWEFLFLGANIDAVGVAQDIGIRAERAVRYNNNSAGVRMNYNIMSNTVSKIREEDLFDELWKSKIEEDYKKNNKK